jgi:hypothetical protein
MSLRRTRGRTGGRVEEQNDERLAAGHDGRQGAGRPHPMRARKRRTPFAARRRGSVRSGSVLLSRKVAQAVPSAQEGLTSVFEMVTGVTPPPLPPKQRPGGGYPPDVLGTWHGVGHPSRPGLIPRDRVADQRSQVLKLLTTHRIGRERRSFERLMAKSHG